MCKLDLKLHFPEGLYCLKGAVIQPGLFPRSVLQAVSAFLHSQPAELFGLLRDTCPVVSGEAQCGCVESAQGRQGRLHI